MTAPSKPVAAAPDADPAELRIHADRMLGIARAADRAAARLDAQDLTHPAAAQRATTGAIRGIATAHRAAATALHTYAGRIDGATHRRRALDDLVDASERLPGDGNRRRHDLTTHVAHLRRELLDQLDADLRRDAADCARALSAATPAPATAHAAADAIHAALDHARHRLQTLTAHPGEHVLAPSPAHPAP